MEYYTTEELAKMLGVHIESVRRWVRKGKLKAYKMGNEYRILKKDFEAYWAACSNIA